MKFSKNIPTKEGFYWFRYTPEHKPCVKELAFDYSDEILSKEILRKIICLFLFCYFFTQKFPNRKF